MARSADHRSAVAANVLPELVWQSRRVLGQRPDWVALGAVRPLQGEALAPCKGKVPNPRSGWCNLLHQLTDGVSRATLECSK